MAVQGRKLTQHLRKTKAQLERDCWRRLAINICKPVLKRYCDVMHLPSKLQKPSVLGNWAFLIPQAITLDAGPVT